MGNEPCELLTADVKMDDYVLFRLNTWKME